MSSLLVVGIGAMAARGGWSGFPNHAADAGCVNFMLYTVAGGGGGDAVVYAAAGDARHPPCALA